MAVDHNNPQSRTEEILIATIDGEEYDKLPQSRLEELLLELKQVIEAGGGGGGTTNYNNLSNKPQVNGITLSGDKSASDLSLVLAEVGKGLSTNDYSDEEKAKVTNLLTAIEGILTGSDIDSFGDVETALSAIKDGTEIDSFGDVEVALLDKADTSDLGTAAAKDSTNAVTSGSTDLVESGAVKSAIDSAVSKCYHHAGTKTCAELLPALLIAANEGNVYEMTDSGTTTSDFMEGIGHPIKEGDNVGVAKIGDGVYKFDLLSGFVDTTNFVQKSSTAGLIKNDGTIDTVEKQPKTDNNLTTTSKDTTGAINELKSGLTNLTDDVKLNTQDLTTPSRTKNLLNYDEWKKVNVIGGSGVFENNGITLTATDDCYTGYNNTDFPVNARIPISEGETITLSWQANNDLSGTQYIFPNGGVSGAVSKNNANGKSLSYTAGSGVTYVTFRFGVGDVGNSIEYSNIQIEKGNTATTFVPYIPSVESRIDDLESGLDTVKSGLTDVNDVIDGVASSPLLFGVYPNGNSYGNATITLPCWSKSAITTGYVKVIDSSGTSVDITNDSSVVRISPCAVQVSTEFNASHVGKQVLVSVSVT